jgi:hypothetical protein
METQKLKRILFLSLVIFGLCVSFFALSNLLQKEESIKKVVSSHLLAKLELDYPEIFGLKPNETTGFEFFKYIFTFVVWSLGFILFIVILYYAVKWYTAGTNIEQAVQARKKIINAFLGAIFILGVWVLLNILGPFAKIKIEIQKPSKVPTQTVVQKPESIKIVVAKEIPLGSLITDSELISAKNPNNQSSFENLTSFRTFGVSSNKKCEIEFGIGEEEGFLRDGVPNSDACYNWKEALVSDQEREQLKISAEKFASSTSRSNFQILYNTTIDEVKAAINSVYEKYCKDCLEGCPPDSPGFTCDASCQSECNKLKNLKNAAESFSNNKDYDPVTSKLEQTREGVKAVEGVEALAVEGTEGAKGALDVQIGSEHFSRFKKEDYTENGKKEVENIANLSKQIDCSQIENCPHCPPPPTVNAPEKTYASVSSGGDYSCGDMKSVIKDFEKGYGIRKAGWDIIKSAHDITNKVAQYTKLIEEKERKSGSDYLYEGTNAQTRIDRILATNNLLELKTDFAQNLALTTGAISAAITALLVGGCHCFECISCCGACPGDACLFVRPLLTALQVALGMCIVAIPPVSMQVQKEINKEMSEKEGLRKSFEKLTKGLVMAEKEIFTCQGVTKRGQFQQLFSAAEFSNYKSEAEKKGYKIVIQKIWPNINPVNNPFTFYCVTGPLIDGISDTQDPNNLQNLKLYCDKSTESEAGELIDKIKKVVKADKENMLKEKSEEIKNAQKIVNEMKRMHSGFEQDLNNVKPDLTDADLTSIGERLQNLPGDQFVNMLGKLPEVYAKQAIGEIFENVGAKDLKNFFVGAFGGMSDDAFKGIFTKYLSSMMDDEVKRFSFAFLSSVPENNLKTILINGFNSFPATNLKNFWGNSFKNFTDVQKLIFFSNYFRDANDDKVENIYPYLTKNLSESEKRKMLKNMLEVTDQITIRNILNPYIKITLNPIKNPSSNHLAKVPEVEASSMDELDLDVVIANIPPEDLDKIFEEAKDSLKSKRLLNEGLGNVSPDILESAILNIPESEIKDFTMHFYEAIELPDIKDFVLDNVLEADPTFFQKFTQDLPKDQMKNLILNQGLMALSDSDARDVFMLMHEFQNKDPRKVLNPLFLKYLPQDKGSLSSGMNALQAAGMLGQFLKEAASLFNFNIAGDVGGLIKDTVDKIGSFIGIENLSRVVNDILGVVKPAMEIYKLAGFVQDIFKQIPNLAVQGILENNVLKNIPYQQLLVGMNDFLKTLPLEELKNVSREVFKALSLNELQGTFGNIINEIPVQEIMVALRTVASTLPLNDLKHFLNTTSFDNKAKIFQNCIYIYLPDEEKEQWKTIKSEQEWKIFSDRIQSKQIVVCAFNYLSEEELRKIFKDSYPKLSKESLSHIMLSLPYVNAHLDQFLNRLSANALRNILGSFPERRLKNFFDIISRNFPETLLRSSLNQALSLFQNSANNLIKELLGFLPKDALNSLVKQLLSAFPAKELGNLVNSVLGELPTQFLDSVLGPLKDILGPVFSILTGGPGLKQNALIMLKYPTEYLTACPRCCVAPCCAPKCPCPCVGTPGPLVACSPAPVLLRMALIAANVAKITFFKGETNKALHTDNRIIDQKIKKDIWPASTYSTKNFASPQCITKEPGREGYLVKCDDALRYGWVERCDHKFNFVCCSKK